MRNFVSNKYPINYKSDGKLDFEYERDLITRCFDQIGISWKKPSPFNYRGIYELSNQRFKNNIYMCCCSDLGRNHNGIFWFGLEDSYLRAYPDLGLLLICVWENKYRDYFCFSNKFVRRWKENWYVKNNYFSIDLIQKNADMIMKGKDFEENINLYRNNEAKLFCHITFL